MAVEAAYSVIIRYEHVVKLICSLPQKWYIKVLLNINLAAEVGLSAHS